AGTSREGRSVDEWGKEVTALFEGFTTPRPDLAVYSRRKTPDLYWQRREATGVPGTLQVAHAFLGLRLECAQCHRHPHDVWQQDDLLSFANFLMRVRPSGFQGDNEKRFPEVATYVKRFNDEAKSLTEEIKKRKETRGKELADELKKTQVEGPKVRAEIARLEKEGEKLDAAGKAKLAELRELAERYQAVQKEFDRTRQEVIAPDRKSELLREVGRRMMHAETQHVAAGPGNPPRYATVTSPLGTQTSKQFRLLGEAKALDIPDNEDPRVYLAAWMRR